MPAWPFPLALTCSSGLGLFSSSNVSSNFAEAGLDWYHSSEGCSCVVKPVSSGASTSSVIVESPLPRDPPVTRTDGAPLEPGRNLTLELGAAAELSAGFTLAVTGLVELSAAWIELGNSKPRAAAAQYERSLVLMMVVLIRSGFTEHW